MAMLALPYYENFSKGRVVVLTKRVDDEKSESDRHSQKAPT